MTTKIIQKNKTTHINTEIEEISQRILEELETASSDDLSKAGYAKKILQISDLKYTKSIFYEIDNVFDASDRTIEKKAIIKALLYSTWLQRLYFIIRSSLMSILAMLVTLVYVSFFGDIGVILAAIMGVLIFIIGLFVTRFFDSQIVRVTKYIISNLENHKKIRDFIVNNL